MSEMAWMRTLQQACSDPEEASVLAKMMDSKFDKAESLNNGAVPRELVWRQAYIHQLAKIAAGLEVAHFGP
jgi:hypothetical protein